MESFLNRILIFIVSAILIGVGSLVVIVVLPDTFQLEPPRSIIGLCVVGMGLTALIGGLRLIFFAFQKGKLLWG